MREIKFRAWHKGRMHYFDLSDTIAPNMEMKVMQYTGLKDKNGVDIYEGDLVKMTGSDVAKLVVYYDQAFYIKNSVSHTRLSKTLFCGEVIGNIHEQPELLKQ